MRAKMKDCAFCRIVKSNTRIFRQTKNTATFLSNPSLVIGHTLVIPKEHYEKLSDMPEKILHELIDEVAFVQTLLCRRLGAQGCDINQHYKPYIPDCKLSIKHVHFHLVPRDLNDKIFLKIGKARGRLFRDLEEKEIKEVELILNSS